MIRHFLNMTLVAILIIFGTTAAAGPDRFSVLLGSKHIGSEDFNEINPGVFATWERGKIAYSVGAYLNSYERGSVAGTVHRSVWQWQKGEASVFGGLAWYPTNGRNFDTHIAEDVVGIAGLHVRQGNVFMQLIPLNDGDASALMTFGLTWSAKR